MKRFTTILAVLSVLVLATSAFGQNRYGWTISNSNADPFSNSGAPLPFGTYYLWYQCSTVDGISAAEFDIVSLGISHLATIVQNGFLNAGGTANLLLAVGGCPLGPVVAANLLVQDAGGTMCLAPSAVNGLNVSVDCRPLPDPWPNDWVGFNSAGTPCPDQSDPSELCPPDAVEQTSWGHLKALYR
jgi:hypothetical protein